MLTFLVNFHIACVIFNMIFNLGTMVSKRLSMKLMVNSFGSFVARSFFSLIPVISMLMVLEIISETIIIKKPKAWKWED